MKLPKQTKPVERKTYNANAVAVGANASGWLDTLGSIAKVALPIAASFV